MAGSPKMQKARDSEDSEPKNIAMFCDSITGNQISTVKQKMNIEYTYEPSISDFDISQLAKNNDQ